MEKIGATERATATEKIAIIGLGLIGGSIALALKHANIAGLHIVGTARTRDTLRAATKLGAIDEEAASPADAVRNARLVIIAAPILTTKAILEEIAPVLDEGTVVTDACSTSGEVMRWAKAILPTHSFFVGSHPMAGKETQGIAAADPNLFQDKAWVISPSVNAPEAAVQTIVGVAQTCGAIPVFMDADEHDSYVAAISHLPFTVSSALFSMAYGSAAWPELASLASSGFRDTTRLASGSPEMMHDIAVTNRDNLLHWIDRFQQELSRYREAIASGDSKTVLETFAKPQIERDNFVAAGPPKRTTEGPKLEGFSVGDMLLGTKVNSYMKKQNEILKDAEAREKKQ